MSEEAEEHVLLRLTYLLAYGTLLLQFALCPMRDLAEAYECPYCHFIRPVLDLGNNCQSPDGYFGNGFIYLLR